MSLFGLVPSMESGRSNFYWYEKIFKFINFFEWNSNPKEVWFFSKQVMHYNKLENFSGENPEPLQP